MTQQLRSIGAASCAKVFAVLYGILGLVIGAGFSLFFMIGAFIGSQALPSEMSAKGGLGILLGIGGLIFFPICYAVIGAIGGLIMSALYNVVAKYVGGVEVEIG